MLDINEIKQIIPHRYPFLYIDKVLACEAGKSASALKNVTINEPFFNGHFPDEPVMPGVVLLETMAQLGGIVIGLDKGVYGYLTGVYNALFIEKVTPGDQLLVEIEIIRRIKSFFRAKGRITVADNLVVKSELGFMVFNDAET